MTNRTVLAVLSFTEDRRSLQKIFDCSHLQLQFARTLSEVQTALSVSSFGALISETGLCDGHRWTDLLFAIQEMQDPPPLIVADRLADESLWAEVLNLGGFDLLAKPFDKKEVLHVMGTACYRREDERRRVAFRQPAESAEDRR